MQLKVIQIWIKNKDVSFETKFVDWEWDYLLKTHKLRHKESHSIAKWRELESCIEREVLVARSTTPTPFI